MKKRNPTELTTRNARASLKRDQVLSERIADLEVWVESNLKIMGHRVDAIERRQEAASRQPERVERDNVEGGQEPTP